MPASDSTACAAAASAGAARIWAAQSASAAQCTALVSQSRLTTPFPKSRKPTTHSDMARTSSIASVKSSSRRIFDVSKAMSCWNSYPLRRRQRSVGLAVERDARPSSAYAPRNIENCCWTRVDQPLRALSLRPRFQHGHGPSPLRLTAKTIHGDQIRILAGSVQFRQAQYQAMNSAMQNRDVPSERA